MKKQSVPASFYFVRHGEVYNPQGLFYGRLPRFRLSPEGLAQSRKLEGFFAQKQPISAIYTSPLLRTRQTARALMGSSLQLPLRQSRLLSEVHTPFDGSPIGLLEERGWDVYKDTGPGYEQPDHVLQRTQSFIRHARRQHKNGTVIAVTHAAVIYFLAMWAHQKPLDPNAPDTLRELGLPLNYPPHASVTRFTYQTDDPDETPKMEYLKL